MLQIGIHVRKYQNKITIENTIIDKQKKCNQKRICSLFHLYTCGQNWCLCWACIWPVYHFIFRIICLFPWLCFRACTQRSNENVFLINCQIKICLLLFSFYDTWKKSVFKFSFGSGSTIEHACERCMSILTSSQKTKILQNL